MRFLTLDFETYYDREYSLKKMTTEEYLRDSRFQVIGCSIAEGAGRAVWYPAGPALDAALQVVDGNAVLAHNTRFDGAILEWHYGLKPARYFDTLSMAAPHHKRTGRLSLDWLTQHYGVGTKGDEVVRAEGKRLEDFDPVSLALYGQYCCNDTELTYHLFRKLLARTPSRELMVIDLLLKMYIRPAFVLNSKVLEDRLAQVRADKAALLERVFEVAGKDALSSNPKFAEVLLSLGVEPPMKLSPAALKRGEEVWTYAFSKGDVEFKALLDHENPMVQAVVAARMGVKSTLEESRIQRLIGIASRGPMPVPLGYSNAHTHRVGGEESINLQNLNRGGAMRHAMEAPPGHQVVTGDSAQIEARVVALLAGQFDLVEAFRQKRDVYSEFASDVYGYKVDRKYKEIRDGEEFYPFELEGRVGKEGILGLGFGMGGPKFQIRLKVQAGIDMPLEQAELVKDKYRSKYPHIKKLWRTCENALREMANGRSGTIGVGIVLRFEGEYVYLPNGMYLHYPQLRYDVAKTSFVYTVTKGRSREDVFIHGPKMVENIVQALARIVVFYQMLEIAARLEALRIDDGVYHVALTVHDEVVCIIPDAHVQWTKQMMREVMSTPPEFAPTLPVSCDIGSGASYGDAK